jgi:hypothetical protein
MTMVDMKNFIISCLVSCWTLTALSPSSFVRTLSGCVHAMRTLRFEPDLLTRSMPLSDLEDSMPEILARYTHLHNDFDRNNGRIKDIFSAPFPASTEIRMMCDMVGRESYEVCTSRCYGVCRRQYSSEEIPLAEFYQKITHDIAAGKMVQVDFKRANSIFSLDSIRAMHELLQCDESVSDRENVFNFISALLWVRKELYLYQRPER